MCDNTTTFMTADEYAATLPEIQWRPAVYLRMDGTLDDFSDLFEVSNYGQVRYTSSHKAESKLKRKKAMEEYPNLRPVKINDGPHEFMNGKIGGTKYCIVKTPAGKSLRVHRLVLSSFQYPGPIPKLEVDHINGLPTNNMLDNLQWLSGKANRQKGGVYAG